MASFFSLANLSALTVEPMEKPWEFTATEEVPYPTSPETKKVFEAWQHAHTTKHAFISMFEGVTAGVRVATSKHSGNPAFRLHGIIADYDSKAPEALLAHVKKHAPCALLPQWLCRTKSGNSRLIWFFEQPLMLANTDQTKKFLAQVIKELKLTKWAAGFDVDAFNETQYFEVGRDWQEVFPGEVIPSAMLEAWIIKASQGIQFDKNKSVRYSIPLNDLSAEMHRRYPGRWQGDLFIGARGVRFWDPSADNTTAAVVAEEGMMCFTGNRAFVSWEDIFGNAFVAKYEAEFIADATVGTAFDGRKFWVETADGTWVDMAKEDFTQHLRIKGFDQARAKGKTYSETDTIEHRVKTMNRVDKALPFLFHKPGRMFYKGVPYVNISRTRVLPPAPKWTDGPMNCISEGKEFYPFLYKFLVSLFSEDQNPYDPQLIAFLSWLKYFYQSSYEMNPGPGHALVLAGEAGKGKTFLSRAVLGTLMGKYAMASDHLVNGQQWTDGLADCAIMGVDDATASTDYRDLAKFTQRLKQYVANSQVAYNAKYGMTGEVPWFGRPIITCNLDTESLRILPGMDVSTRDKIMLFKTSPVKVNFLAYSENQRVLDKELPFFARFLLEWPIPEDRLSTEARFHVKAYHDKGLFDEALFQSADGTTSEALIGFLNDYFDRYPEAQAWTGTGLMLHSDMSALYEYVMRTIKPRQLVTCLGNLAKNGFDLGRSRERGNRIWTIPRSFIEQHQNGVTGGITHADT